MAATLTHPAVALESLTPDQQEFVTLLDESAHVDVWSHPQSGERPRFSELRGIIFNGQRYADKGAACACAQMRLYKFGDEGYTVCQEHGVLAIGYMRREYAARPNGRR